MQFDTKANKRISASGAAAQNRRSRPAAKVPGTNSIMRPRPVPSPRNSLPREKPAQPTPEPLTKQSNTTHPVESLINLDSPEEMSTPRPKDLGVSSDYEFDPLNHSVQESVIKTQSNPQLNTAISELEQDLLGEGSVVAPSRGPVLRPPSDKKAPTPRPRSSIISRNNAFYKGNRPPSIRRRSPTSQAMDATTIKEARSVFMQANASNTSLHKMDPLDQFDPLVTGRVAMDTHDPSSRTPPAASPQHQEEDLLKEWNLDFTRLRPTTSVAGSAPMVPPQATVTGPRLTPNKSSLHGSYQSTAALHPYQVPSAFPQANSVNSNTLVGASPGTVAQRISQYNVPGQRGGYSPPVPGVLQPPPHTVVPPVHSSPAPCDPFPSDITPAALAAPTSVAQNRASWQTFDN